MIADAAFTLLNQSKVESVLRNAFPNLDVKKLATVEGVVGLTILSLKIATSTVV